MWGKLRIASPEYLADGCDAPSGNTAAGQLVELYHLLPWEEFEVKVIIFFVFKQLFTRCFTYRNWTLGYSSGFFYHCSVTCPVLNFLVYILQALFKY